MLLERSSGSLTDSLARNNAFTGLFVQSALDPPRRPFRAAAAAAATAAAAAAPRRSPICFPDLLAYSWPPGNWIIRPGKRTPSTCQEAFTFPAQNSALTRARNRRSPRDRRVVARIMTHLIDS